MEKVLRFTTSSECRMAALVRHFGDVEDASRPCGICDVCDPAGAVLRLFRRPAAVERQMVQAIADELRAVDYKAAGTLQRNLDLVGRLSRNEFDALLDAMARAGLIGIEEAEYEKDGEMKRFRKVRLTEAGLELRATSPVELLLSDGVVEEFGGHGPAPARAKKPKAAPAKLSGEPISHPSDKNKNVARVGHPLSNAIHENALTSQGEALAARLKAWRAEEAKRLRVPAYVVMNDRTLAALVQRRPANPRQLLEVSGMGPAKVERFGAAILELCGAAGQK
jgi:superfamily II DNA helicase RecQ